MNTLLRKYKRLEANNDHDEAALLLVTTFGTEDERATIKAITERHTKQGFLTHQDVRLRFETSNKYYKLLTKLN